MIAWLETHHDLLIAIATVVLAAFGGLQVLLAVWDRRTARTTASGRLQGPAWLARRSLEAALVAATGEDSAKDWFRAVGNSARLDRLQGHMLSALRIGTASRPQDAKHIRLAFAEFLAYADHVNHIGTIHPTVKDSAGHPMDFSAADRNVINQDARSAITHLRSAIDHLGNVVPRRSSEPQLPHDDELRLLTGSPVPR